jgi:glycosyltransferase involved in cell wall biosynthesis
MPRVTVICPAYNRGSAIERTIQSVIRQSMTDWEMIVASDASDDDTDEVVLRIAEREPRVRLIRTQRFGFPSGPCNIASREARSDVIAYIPHDDEWEPHHLEVLCGALDAGADLAYTRARMVDPAGRFLWISNALAQYWHPELQVMSAMFEPARAAYRAKLVEEVGGWLESPVGLEDWDLWLRLADTGVRFTPLADITVNIMHSRTTRQHSLPCDYSVEIARFPDARSARAAFRAVTDLRLVDKFRAAYHQDLAVWYRRLESSGELAAPLEWQQDPTRLSAAMAEALADDDDLRGAGRIERDGDQYVLVDTVPTQRAEHAVRVGECYRRVMLETWTLLMDVIRRSVPEAVIPAPGSVFRLPKPVRTE